MPNTVSSVNPGIQDTLLDLFLYLGSEWILYLLIFLSVLSITIAIERMIYFVKEHDDLERLHAAIGSHLAAGELDKARESLQKSRSPVGRIALSGLEAFNRGAATVEEIMAGTALLERSKMERGLAFLGTLGNNAPFIGLFGTVLGIVRSFRDLSGSALNTSAVMAGIAEALVATAVGLLVALPAVSVFNYFQRMIRGRLVISEAMSKLLLAYVKEEKGSR